MPANSARYRLATEIASGGMATVHLGRVHGSGGFAKTVAIKRLHAHYAKDGEFVSMFLSEARVAARIRHPNVVSIVDVVSGPEGLLLVMEYVEGESLARLVSAPIDPAIVVSVITGVLHGLHAAHEAQAEDGRPLGIVHRDVSPQNVLVGVDGVARVLDFGIATATALSHATRDGQVKGKFPYMSPEQIENTPLDRRSDVWAAGVVLWEMLAGKRLFSGDNPAALCHAVLHEPVVPPSRSRPELPAALDAVVLRALARDAGERWATARDMALALERAHPPATVSAVGEWVANAARQALVDRARAVMALESGAALSAKVDSEAPTIVSRVAPTPRRRRWLVGAATGAAIIVLFALSGLASRGETSTPQLIFSTLPPAIASVTPSVTPQTTPRASASIELAAPAPAPRAPSAPRSQRAKPNCSPPYVRDAMGVKSYKRECLTE